MTSDSKKAKAVDVPKKEPAAKDKSTSGEVASKTESGKASGEVVSKTESGDAAVAAPSNYSRGEGQKPVSAAYKENWNAIFAKKKPKRKR